MNLDAFVQAFNRLGLAQWEGIEEDLAWGLHLPRAGTAWKVVPNSGSASGYNQLESITSAF